VGRMSIFPPQPAQQAQQDPRQQSLPQAAGAGMPQQAAGSRRASQLGPGGEGALPPAPSAAVAAGALKHWSSLREHSGAHTVPFSRQSSPTPPGMSQQEEAGPPAKQGSSRRGSWGGAWDQVETGVAAGSHWPS